MAQSPELQSKIAQWRARQVEGGMAINDWVEAFRMMRADRNRAQEASAASKARAPRGPVDTNALKDSLRAFAKK